MKRSLRCLFTALPLVTSSLAFAKDRPRLDAFADAAPIAARPPHAAFAAPPGVVTSRDEKRGTPTFFWADAKGAAAPVGASIEDAARAHATAHAARWALSPAAVAATRVVRVHDIGRGGILVTLRQSVDGVELFHHDLKVLMTRELGLVALAGGLHEGAVPSAKHGAFTSPDVAAVAVALGDLYDKTVPLSALLRGADMEGGYHTYSVDGATEAALGVRLQMPSRVKRVYFALPDRLVAAYFLEVSARAVGEKLSDTYAYVVAADDGRVLFRSNLKHSAGFSYRVWADTTGDLRPLDGPIADTTPYPAPLPNGMFPPTIPSSLISIDAFNKNHDPWLPDGATETQGNNVDAYTDDDNPNGFSKNDVRAHVTSPGVFDIPIDLTKGPQDTLNQRMGAVTSLFYVTNWLHDWWYDSGFDEKGLNAQKDNLGRGGIAGDPLFAEAQNGAPGERNNSNMDVMADGVSPRMQMFVWDGKGAQSLSLNGGTPDTAVGAAGFSPPSFDVTADVVHADDGTAPNDDVCQPIMNDVKGKIALVQRGKCTFAAKAQTALDAGAAGVILYDNVSGEPAPNMPAGMGAGIVKIPILSITLDAGTALVAALASGPVSAHLVRVHAPDVDGTLDNTIVAHEWAHYLHLRIVQGGSQSLFAQSEGWADFNALLMVLRPKDDLAGAYPLAQWATIAFPQDPAYFGVRRYPYSTDMTKNPLTFKHITSGTALPTTAPVEKQASMNDNAEVHAAGEVWASMMFEAYVALLKTHPYAEAHRKMSDYVVLGMATAPTDPTYTEQRDAVLAAAAASSAADFQAMAEGFARRGAGTCAVSPPRDSMDFVGVVESFTVDANVSIKSIALDDSGVSCDHDGALDAGETGKVTVVVKNGGGAPFPDATATITTTAPGLSFPSGTKLSFGTLAPYGSATATVDVALANTVTGKQSAALTIKLDGAKSCDGTDAVTTSLLVDYDEAATGLKTDSVEAKATAWTIAGTVAKDVWKIADVGGGNHAWTGADHPSPSDTSLVSPPFEVSATDPFVLTFKQAYQFEHSMGVSFDGAVIEVSTDAGKTWQDISMFGDPGYGGMIGMANPMATNPLNTRMGYVDHNASYPKMDEQTIDMGTSLAGKTVQIRFRIGTDDAQGAPGWQLDDLAFSGIVNAPFSGVVDDKGLCKGGAGGAGGGGASGATTGTGGAPGTGGAAAGGGAAIGGASGSGVGGAMAKGGASSLKPPTSPALPPPEATGGGCDCATSPASGRARTPLALALLGLGALLGRRRRAPRNPS